MEGCKLVSPGLSSIPQSCPAVFRMSIETNYVRAEVLLLANYVTKGGKQGCHLFLYAVTCLKVRGFGVFLFVLFLFQGSSNEKGWLSLFLLDFFPCWLPEVCVCLCCLGRVQRYSYGHLGSWRTEVRVCVRSGERNTYSDSGLLYSFTFNWFSFMSKFANRIFAAWLHA